jgi:hypothetical protein
MNRPIVCGLLAVAAAVAAEDARQIVTESQNRLRSQSERYEGTLEVSNAKRKVSTKRWTYERLGAFGNSKSLLRFTAPPEVKGVALLVMNHPDRASDQWMWIPAEERDRRIALQDRSTRFFGTDFSFEDMEERDVNQFDFRMDGDEVEGGKPCWRITSTPKESKSSQYTSSTLWIRKNDFVMARIDNFNRGKLVRQITYSNIQTINGIATPRTIAVFDPGKNSRTVLTLEDVQYNVPMNDEGFTRDALRK